MKINTTKFSLLLLAGAVVSTPYVFADSSTVTKGISKALSDSKVNVSLRARYEAVDQDGLPDDANALTLKSRLTLKTGAFKGLSLGLEVDDVTQIVDDYNSTANGKSNYPVVADPEGTDINQAYLQFKNQKLTVTAGRQRILHNNQRFVGGVGWRQNEQTYDGYRIQFKATGKFSVDYSYVHNVNRIFGPDGDKADLSGDLHLANADFNVNKNHKISAFAYLLDFDTAASASTDTYGVLYKGKFGLINVNLSAASQSDTGDNLNDFTANYYNAEIGTKIGKITLLGGLEVLGSDDGNVAFGTPLATLHKFQGFADKFLGTPNNGVEDIYVTAKTKLNGIKLAATYHNLSSDEGSIDYGTEVDLVAAYKVNSYNFLVKFASYDADERGTNTNKLWLQVATKF